MVTAKKNKFWSPCAWICKGNAYFRSPERPPRGGAFRGENAKIHVFLYVNTRVSYGCDVVMLISVIIKVVVRTQIILYYKLYHTI